MLLLFMCLLFCAISNAEYSARCGSGDGLSFVESGDRVQGRYRLEWCMHIDRSMGQSVEWVGSLRYNISRIPENCLRSKSQWERWKAHSYFVEDVTLGLNCTNVCLSTNLDLISNGTYHFKTHLRTRPDSIKMQRCCDSDYEYYVHNNYAEDAFFNSKTVISIYNSGDYMAAHWFLHLVPATEYNIYLCPISEPELQKEECTDVTNNCSTTVPNQTEIHCRLQPPAQLYNLRLTHNTPWSNGVCLFEKIASVELSSATFVVPEEPPGVAPPASAAPWWALGGVLILALGGGAALLACHSHILRKLRKRVQLDWRTRTQTGEVTKRDGGGQSVLLLYARDCAPMMTVAAQLRALLQRSADRVYDLYSAEVVREAARAPAEWLRHAMARADVRVVLLQSPAAACLHASAPAAARLEQPLLNRRVMYRAPHSSDSLLPLALRLLADTAHTTHSYKKFYVATINGLEAELVREVTPLRRYSLPAATEVLLQDLCDGTLDRDVELVAQIQRFFKAVRDLHDHVRANPDYLDEELIFFDYD